MTLLLKEEITFPRWDGDPEFDPYCTYKVLADTLKYGRSLDAAERAADDETRTRSSPGRTPWNST